MKAVLFREHGGLDKLRYEDVEEPTPGPHDVVIRVRACGVNRADIGVMMVPQPKGHSSGSAAGLGFVGFQLPHVPGVDVSGEIAAVGTEVTGWKVGDRVVHYSVLHCGGICDLCRRGLPENYCRYWHVTGLQRWGGYAEYLLSPARNLVRLPDNVSHTSAASLAVVYLTAWHSLTRAQLSSADSVLVLAAGSGVGSAGMDIAKLKGARVIAAAGTDEKVARALTLGAHGGVNYTKPGWSEEVKRLTDGKGVDVILDSVGESTWSESMKSLDRAGRIAMCGGTGGCKVEVDLRAWYRNDVTMYTTMSGSYGDLETLVEHASKGELTPVIDRQYPLAEARAAQQRLEDRLNFGKIVLEV